MIQIGACDDKVTAADTAKLSATAFTGAATYSLIQSIEQWGPNQTYTQVCVRCVCGVVDTKNSGKSLSCSG